MINLTFWQISFFTTQGFFLLEYKAKDFLSYTIIVDCKQETFFELCSYSYGWKTQVYIFNMASGNKNSVLSALQDVSVEKPGKQDKNGTQINKKINKKEYYSHLAL